MDIAFLPHRFWDAQTNSVLFYAVVDGKKVRCRVSEASLGPTIDSRKALSKFDDGREKFEARFRALIEERKTYERDGTREVGI